MKGPYLDYVILDVLDSHIGECDNFKWKEALWLSQWNIHAFPGSVVIQKNIAKTAVKLDQIRNILKKPVVVTSWYRPEIYNKAIGGAKHSYHMEGLAVDFVVKGMPCDLVREKLLEHLDQLDIRMEDLPGASWVHIDLGHVVGRRFFKP